MGVGPLVDWAFIAGIQLSAMVQKRGLARGATAQCKATASGLIGLSAGVLPAVRHSSV